MEVREWICRFHIYWFEAIELYVRMDFHRCAALLSVFSSLLHKMHLSFYLRRTSLDVLKF